VFIRIFKGSPGVQFIILVITMALLWLPAFRHSYPMPLPELIAPAYGFTYNLLSNSPVWYTIIAMVLVLGGSVLLNMLLSDFGLTPKNSWLVSFVYIVFMSCSTNYLTLHPVLIINIIIMVMLRMIFIANHKEDSLKETFASGLLVALCSLFIFKSAGLLLGVWFFLVVLRVYSWRQWLTNLVGFITVYIYVFAWYLLTGQVTLKLQLYRSVLYSIRLFHWSLHLSVYEYILFGLFLFLMLVSVVNLLYNVSDKLINLRRISMVLFWLLIISQASALLYLTNPLFDFAFILFPASIVATLYFYNLKKTFFGEMMIVLILAGIVLSRM
jgi:hypothetical protein